MQPVNEAYTIIALGFGPFDTYEMAKYSLFDMLDDTTRRNGLGANVVWAVSRYGVKDLLDEYAIPTDTIVRVRTGETENPITDGPPRPFLEWPKYGSGDVRVFVCSSVTVEDTGNSRVLFDGGEFARDILTPDVPRVVMHYRDGHCGSSDLPQDDFMHHDFVNNGVLHLPRDARSEKSYEATSRAIGDLVKDLWDKGLEIPFDTYMKIATTAFQNQMA